MSQQESTPPDVVRTRRFELVDADGKVLAVLGEFGQADSGRGGGDNATLALEGVGLALLDGEGRPLAVLLGPRPDSPAGLAVQFRIYDSERTNLVDLSVDRQGGGLHIWIQGRPVLSLFTSGAVGMLRMTDGHFHDRVLLQSSHAGGRPTLELRDAVEGRDPRTKGKILFKASDVPPQGRRSYRPGPASEGSVPPATGGSPPETD